MEITCPTSPACPADPRSERLLSLLMKQIRTWRDCPTGALYENGYSESMVTAATLEGMFEKAARQGITAPDAAVECAESFMKYEAATPCGAVWAQAIEECLVEAGLRKPVLAASRSGWHQRQDR